MIILTTGLNLESESARLKLMLVMQVKITYSTCDVNLNL